MTRSEQSFRDRFAEHFRVALEEREIRVGVIEADEPVAVTLLYHSRYYLEDGRAEVVHGNLSAYLDFILAFDGENFDELYDWFPERLYVIEQPRGIERPHRYRVEAEWMREQHADELSIEELEAAMNETVEILHDWPSAR